MKQHSFLFWCLGYVAWSSLLSGPVGAAETAHTIDAVTVTPAVVVLEEGAAVTVTAEIADKDVFQRSVHVQQQGTDGQWRIAGLMEKTDKTRWTYTQTVSTTAVLRLRVGAIFRQPWEVVVSSAHLVRVGQVVEPAEETIVSGPEGVQLRVLPGALNVPAVLTVAPVPTEEVAAPLGSRPVVAAVDVVVEPVEDLPGLIYLVDQPFELSLPLPEGLSATDQFYVAVQGLADVVDEGQEGIAPRLIVVDTGVVEDGRIVSQATDLAGIFSSGRYVVQQKIGSGFVEGVVTAFNSPRGSGISPQGGVLVRVDKDMNSVTGEIFDNQEVFYTDADGRYKLAINGDTFEIHAEDLFSCAATRVAGTLPFPDATVTSDIELGIRFNPTESRPGLHNGGFELSDNSCFRTPAELLDPSPTPIGGNSPIPRNDIALGGLSDSLGPWTDLRGESLAPLEGVQMLAIPGSGRVFPGNFVSYSFRLPMGIDAESEILYVHGNVGCRSDFFDCGAPAVAGDPRLDDILTLSLESDTNNVELAVPATEFLDGWKDLEIPFSGLGVAGGDLITLSFSYDEGGTSDIADFLVDNLRFNTIWLDVKIVNGSGADEARVRRNVRDANEILAQTGLNVRIRNIQTIADPGGLLDTDVSLIPSGPHFLPTTEEQALLGLARSTTETDINVYYVRSLEGLSSEAWGIAIGPDDYVLGDAKAERGIILADLAFSGSLSVLNQGDLDRELLAHELGHLLIPFGTASGSLEHGVEVDDPDTGLPVADTTNIMQSTRCKAPEVIDLDDPTQPCYARTFFNTEQTEFIQMPSLDTDFIDPTNP